MGKSDAGGIMRRETATFQTEDTGYTGVPNCNAVYSTSRWVKMTFRLGFRHGKLIPSFAWNNVSCCLPLRGISWRETSRFSIFCVPTNPSNFLCTRPVLHLKRSFATTVRSVRQKICFVTLSLSWPWRLKSLLCNHLSKLIVRFFFAKLSNFEH